MSGRLVHFELPARDPERAKSFYAALFGWEFETWNGPDEYYMIEGEPAGALYAVENGDTGPIVYFDVDDIDGAIEQVEQLGGRAEEKQAIPTIGWFARCWDTEGNPFSLFKADSSVAAPEGAWEEPQTAEFAD
jgi:predicted enzyme related to lactoylglutathione lyase